MSASKPGGTVTLVGSRGVDAFSFILAYRRCGSTFVGVIEAPQTCVTWRTGACVATTGLRAAHSTVGTGTR